ncbi:septation protein SepH, partial [Kocuria oceani]
RPRVMATGQVVEVTVPPVTGVQNYAALLVPECDRDPDAPEPRAQKVEIEDRSAHRGYHSVFEGEPLTLGRAVAHRAGDLGVDPSSLEWDSWQREDHLWTVVARFSVADAGSAPTQDEPQAEWLYNPANQSVRPASSWAEALTETGTPDTPLGAGLGVLDGGLDPELTQLRRSAVEADDL